MTNTKIQSIIRKLNAGKCSDSIFIRPLTESVDYAKVWIEPTEEAYDFYFIKVGIVYVGAVLDMGSDLHWFVINKFRGKGHLTRNMRDTILPHLFGSRITQKITIVQGAIGITNYNRSVRVAQALGFKSVGDNVYTLSKLSIDKAIPIGMNRPMAIERLQLLKSRAKLAAVEVQKIADELKMTFLDSGSIEQIAVQNRSLSRQIDDVYWRSNSDKPLT